MALEAMRRLSIPVLALLLATSCAASPPLIAPPDFAPGTPVASVLMYLNGGGGKCSAVAIAPRVALTAEHCIELESAGTLYGAVGEEPDGDVMVQSYRVTRREWDARDDHDIAVLEVDPAGPAFPEWADIAVRLPTAGELLVIVGHGCNDDPPVRPAVAGAVAGDSIYFYGLLCGGDSGGGLFNDGGELVAINVRRSLDSKFGAATLVGYATRLLDRFAVAGGAETGSEYLEPQPARPW